MGRGDVVMVCMAPVDTDADATSKGLRGAESSRRRAGAGRGEFVGGDRRG